MCFYIDLSFGIRYNFWQILWGSSMIHNCDTLNKWVQGMVGLMLVSAQPLLRKWEGCIDAQGGLVAEIRVDEDLRCLSADVISRACFGSSYSKGKLIFSKLRLLQKTISIQSVLFGVPTFGYVHGPHTFPPILTHDICDKYKSSIYTSAWYDLRLILEYHAHMPPRTVLQNDTVIDRKNMNCIYYQKYLGRFWPLL